MTIESTPLAARPYSSWNHIRSLSWGAVLAGAVAALAFHILFVMLGAGIGFAIYTPLRDENAVASLGGGALVIQGLSAVFSLWFGGWVAGRCTTKTSLKLGSLHGLLVWSVATIAGVLVVSTGAGWAMGDLSKVVGGGLSMAGKPAAVGQGSELAKTSAARNTTMLGSFVDEGVASRPGTPDQSATIRARREIGLAVARLFAPGQRTNRAENRAAAVQALVASGTSQEDANRIVNDWISSYDKLKADLEEAKNEAELRAREAAERAAHTLSVFSFCSFFAFVIGAVAAALGGKHGSLYAARHAETVVLAE